MKTTSILMIVAAALVLGCAVCIHLFGANLGHMLHGR